MSSFWRGFLSLTALFQGRDHAPMDAPIVYPWPSESAALHNDWKRVGGDLRRALRSYERQGTKGQMHLFDVSTK